MSHAILKRAPDSDCYLVWSTIVDAPVFVGTWEELVQWKVDRAAEEARDHLARLRPKLDELGTSAFHRPGFGEPWTDPRPMEETFEVQTPDGWIDGMTREELFEYALHDTIPERLVEL